MSPNERLQAIADRVETYAQQNTGRDWNLIYDLRAILEVDETQPVGQPPRSSGILRGRTHGGNRPDQDGSTNARS
jgi:hypothetical protein